MNRMLFKRVGGGGQERALRNLKHDNRNVKIQKKSCIMEIFQKNRGRNGGKK